MSKALIIVGVLGAAGVACYLIWKKSKDQTTTSVTDTTAHAKIVDAQNALDKLALKTSIPIAEAKGKVGTLTKLSSLSSFEQKINFLKQQGPYNHSPALQPVF